MPAQETNPHPSRLKISASFATATPHPDTPAPSELAPSLLPRQTPAPSLGTGPAVPSAHGHGVPTLPGQALGQQREAESQVLVGFGKRAGQGMRQTEGRRDGTVCGHCSRPWSAHSREEGRGESPGEKRCWCYQGISAWKSSEDVQEQLGDGERDAQTCPPRPEHLKGCVGTEGAQKSSGRLTPGQEEQ